MLLQRLYADFDAALEWPFDDDELLDAPSPAEHGPDTEAPLA